MINELESFLFLPTTNQTINRPIKPQDLERGEEGK